MIAGVYVHARGAFGSRALLTMAICALCTQRPGSAAHRLPLLPPPHHQTRGAALYAANPSLNARSRAPPSPLPRLLPPPAASSLHLHHQQQQPTTTTTTTTIATTATIYYYLYLDSAKPVTGVSVYNVMPEKAANYFNKIQCFCFEEQRLRGGEEVRACRCVPRRRRGARGGGAAVAVAAAAAAAREEQRPLGEEEGGQRRTATCSAAVQCVVQTRYPKGEGVMATNLLPRTVVVPLPNAIFSSPHPPPHTHIHTHHAPYQVDMPVFFYIDPEFATDWNCRNINDITLSYTFFKAEAGNAQGNDDDDASTVIKLHGRLPPAGLPAPAAAAALSSNIKYEVVADQAYCNVDESPAASTGGSSPSPAAVTATGQQQAAAAVAQKAPKQPAAAAAAKPPPPPTAVAASPAESRQAAAAAAVKTRD